jgi:nucleoside-diphosphate-sugar epimerase
MKALITGGGGFLGRAIVEALVSAGHEVTVVGRHPYPEVAALGARCLQSDVATADLTASLRGHDVVIHTAAKAGVWGDPAEYRRTNVEGTRRVVAACRAAGVPRLVYTSSPSVVFDGQDHEGVTERPYPARYEAVYPETKAAAERLVLGASGDEMATVALRPHLIYGPRDPHLLPRLFARAKARRLAIVGAGTNRVSVTYVDNAAAAHVQAALRLEPGCPFAGRAFFVNDPEPVQLWPWLNGLLARVGLPPVTRRIPPALARAAGAAAEGLWPLLRLNGEPPMTRFVAAQLASSHWYDVTPAREAFGYVPPVGPDEALARTAEYWSGRV